MGVRATCTHITSESNQTIRVDLIGASYSGSSREVVGAGTNWMRFTHDQLDYSNIFNTVVQRGRLEFSFHIKDADDKQVIDDVLATTQGEYTLAYYVGGTLQWIGEVMMDQLGSLSVGEPYPYAVTLVARDFVPLEGQLFPLEDNRQLATTVLGRLLSATGYDLPIWTHTSWVTTGTNSSNDFLRQVYIDTRNLRDFAKEGDIQITYLEALNRIVAPFRAVLRQAGGVFVLDQLSAYETPSSVLRTIYDKDGAYQSQSNVNTTISANSSVTVVRGSIDEIKPGYKRAEITYNHRTPQSDILFLPRVVLTVAEPSDVTGSEFIEQGREIALTGEAFVNYSSAVASNDRPFASIEIEHNGYYWNDALKVWQNSSYTNFYTMQPSNQLPSINLDDTAYDIFNVPINIRTQPTVTSGVLTVKLKKSSNPSGITSETVYLNMDFQIITDSEDEGSTAIRYITEQPLSFTQNYNGGVYYFGDGPTQRSASALRRSLTVTDLTTSWTRRGDSDDLEFHEIALKEIMDHYRGYGRIGSYIIKQGNYTPLNILTYETKAFYYVGGTFDGFTGWWSPIVFELDLATGTDQLFVGYVSGPSLIASTTLTAVSLATNNSIEANANYVFRLAEQASGTVTQLIVEPMNSDYPLLRTDTNIRVVHPVTLEQYTFTLSQDMFAGSLVIQVVSVEITNPLPKGSYIYTNAGDGTAALIIGRDSIRLIAESTAVGVTTSESLGSVTSIAVRLNTRVQAGDDLFLVRTLDAVKRAFTVGQTVGPGVVTLQIDQPTVFDAPAGSYIIGSNAQYEAFLQVTPAGVLAKAEAVTTQNSFAILSAPLPSGTSTSTIPVTSVRTLKLLDASQIGVQDRAGNTEFFQVDGEQNLSPATTLITVVSKAPSVNVGAGAGVFQPSWNQTAILSVQAGEIATRVTSAEVQTLIDQNIDGLLPALSLPFENSADGFTGTNATLTPDTTYLEYLATGSTPFMQRTTSYSASDNPIITMRVQRIAGTNWGGAFGWSTDGTNFTTQNFIEPTGVDDDFQFTTIDLTSNGSYTGTITAIRIYLGEANLDEFYIDTLSVGKFNPQTEILADLSSRLTVAEAGLTNTANEFTTYTQNGVLLNGSAKVNEIRNATTMYDTVIITDTRGGFTVKNNQDYYLVNTDGTFQAVKIRDDQTIEDVSSPTNVTLKIQSVTFSTTIQVGGVLYESAFTQSTRISQTQGRIVLQATESSPGSGEIETLALIRLDGTGPSSSVSIQGDLVAINDIQITRGTGANPGVIQTSNFVSGSTGWRIKGDGNAEFNDVTVRGSVFVTGGDAATQTYADTAASGALTDALEALSVTIRSATEPTTRPNGDALRAGDIWIDTGDGDAPYSYNGSAFIAAYTSISGGSIKTGTIDADIVTVSAGDGNVTIDNTGISLSSGALDERRALVFGDYATGVFLASFTTGNLYVGGVDGNGFNIDSVGVITDLLSITFRTSDLRLATANENSTSSTTGTIQVRNGGIGVSGASWFGSSVTANSLVVGTQTNKATITYATNTARTFTIPDVSGNRTFAFINQSQTYSATQTFGYENFRLRNSGSVGHAIVRYGITGEVDRTYTFSGANGTIWTSGNLGMSAITPPAPITVNKHVLIQFDGKIYRIAAEETDAP